MDREDGTGKAITRKVMGKLEKIHLKDESSKAERANTTLEKFLRTIEMSISNQRIKFLQLFPNYVFRWNFGQRLPKKVNPGNE